MERVTFKEGDKIQIIKEWYNNKFPVGTILTVGRVAVRAHGTFIYPKETLDAGNKVSNIDSEKVIKVADKFWKEG